MFDEKENEKKRKEGGDSSTCFSKPRHCSVRLNPMKTLTCNQFAACFLSLFGKRDRQ
jgi:hypothetical protein